ncbi:MAG: 1-acyl-sn-glycerol-3-phosphate acyltransferase, partial [Pseudomonadota bacterium]
HPTGIADGLVLWRIIASRRSDAFFFANADVLHVLPRPQQAIAPVQWRAARRSHSRSRETIAFARRAFLEDERLGVIFPSGRLAKRRGLRLEERPWMSSAAILARKFDLPIVPVHIAARNSLLYYVFDVVHPSLRDITLFHETLNKGRQNFTVNVGAPIPPATLPTDPVLATEMLRQSTLGLGTRLRLFGPTAPRSAERQLARLLPVSGRV